MNIKLSRLAAVVAVSLSIASVASASSSSEPMPSEADTPIVEDGANLNDTLKAPVVTKCIRTYTGSCDNFKISCKRSGGSLAGSCPGDNGELFCWTCTK